MARKLVMPDKVLRRVRRDVIYSTRYESKGTLKAKYGDQAKVWRIVYVANGQWCLQKFDPPKEINAVGNGDGGKRYLYNGNLDTNYKDHVGSYWQDYGRPTTYEIALTQLKRRDQMIQASA